MLGFIKPKKLKEVERLTTRTENIYDPGSDFIDNSYAFEYFDEKTGEYRPLSGMFFFDECEAQVVIAREEWDELIDEEIEELDSQKEQLKDRRKEIHAKIQLFVENVDPRTPSDKLPEELRDLTLDDLSRLRELERELEEEIDHLTRKEERIRAIMEEKGWGKKYGASNQSNRLHGYDHLIKTEKRDGKDVFYADLGEETGGALGRIEAASLRELRQKVNSEIEKNRDIQRPIPRHSDGWFMRGVEEKIASLSAAETRYLIELYNIAVFSNAPNRKLARERIYELLDRSSSLERSEKEEMRKEAIVFNKVKDADALWDYGTFSNYINAYLAKSNCKLTDFASDAGCSRTTLYRNMNGTSQPKRRNALRMAVAMELPPEEIKNFMASAGHPFPRDDVDREVIRLVNEKKKRMDILIFLGVGIE